MLLYAFNLRKPQSQKSFNYFFLASSLITFLAIPIMSQSIKKENIKSLIEELTPSHSIEKSYKNKYIDIIGFDILDRNKNLITSLKFNFYPRNQFYIILYGKKKITGEKSREENKLGRVKAVLQHQNGGYFWNTKTSYLIAKQEIKDTFEEWQIGGIHKIRFAFKTPEYALPGKYTLIITKEKSDQPKIKSSITVDKIKINIKSPKLHKIEKIEDYNLSLKGCLLNPAVLRSGYIFFPWTGNIEFYIDKDLRNFKKIIVAAKGTPSLGIYPRLQVFVDKRRIGNVYVDGEWSKYEFGLNLDKERHILKVRFDNDGGGLGEGRHMFVNLIKLVR